jgi:hypothetical protein
MLTNKGEYGKSNFLLKMTVHADLKGDMQWIKIFQSRRLINNIFLAKKAVDGGESTFFVG